MYLRYLFIFILQLFSIQAIYAQLSKEKRIVTEIMDEIYHYNFDKADSYILQIDSLAKPEVFNFLKSQYYRWTELPIHEKKGRVLTEYYRYINVDHEPKSLLDTLVYFNNKLLKAEYYYNNGQIYPAITQALSLYNLLEPKLQIDNEAIQKEWLLPLSLYQYYYDYYKNSSSLLYGTIWLFEKGDKQKGLEGLRLLANSNEFGRTEALIYLSHIYLRLENQADSAFKYSQILHESYPENMKFYELLIESNLSSNNSDVDLSLLIEKLVKSKSSYFTKYGIVYQALYTNGINRKDYITLLEETIVKVELLGGGSHLKSLLYTKLSYVSEDESSKERYKKLAYKHRQYEYNLTIIN